MENDVRLFQKLLTLGETIQELRCSRHIEIQKSHSLSPLSSICVEEEEEKEADTMEKNDYKVKLLSVDLTEAINRL